MRGAKPALPVRHSFWESGTKEEKWLPRRVSRLFWSFSTTGCHFSSFVSFSQQYGGQAGQCGDARLRWGRPRLWAKADEVSGNGMAAVSGDVANHDRNDFAIAVVAFAWPERGTARIVSGKWLD